MMTVILLFVFIFGISIHSARPDITESISLQNGTQELEPDFVERRRNSDENNRVIIGILAHEYDKTRLHIDRSYVQFIEGSGAQVVPIMSNGSRQYLTRLFYSVNGILLPGGMVSLSNSNYAKASRILFNLAVRENNKNIYFPLWSECLGFQFMMREAAIKETGGSRQLRSHCNTWNASFNAEFTVNPSQTRLFGDAPKSVIQTMKTQTVLAHNHNYCVTVDNFQKFQIYKQYRQLIVNEDSTGRRFVSAIEGIDYPFYGLGFHPEKTMYHWMAKKNVPHTKPALDVAQYLGNFFVNEARKNMHHFESVEEEQGNLIYNYNPEFYTEIDDDFGEQAYFFYK